MGDQSSPKLPASRPAPNEQAAKAAPASAAAKQPGAATKPAATAAANTPAKPATAAAQKPAAPAAGKPAATAATANGAAAAVTRPAAQQQAAAKPAAQQAAPKHQAAQQPANLGFQAVGSGGSVLEEFEEMQSQSSIGLGQMLPSVAISLVVHMIALIALGMMSGAPTEVIQTRDLVASVSDEKGDTMDTIETPAVPLDVETPQDFAQTDATTVVAEAAPMAASSDVQLSDSSSNVIAVDRLLDKVGGGDGSGSSLSSIRNSSNKMATVVARGGNSASEAAVARALEWITNHQLEDGGWSLRHDQCPKCKGKCKDPGTSDSRMGATALAVLPYLGAGQTHKAGKYKANVAAGLQFITRNMKVTANGGDCSSGGGSMYSHGLCAIALCEAYAMTQDKSLAQPAQLALNYIQFAQDPAGGGWRYAPKQPGDTSVVGWQLMALKSGYLGGLQFRPDTIKLAVRFLDHVQADGGANYGYTDPGKGPATSAVGLLCRMYLGWKRETPALEKGMKFLAARGPAPNDIYFNYYATQVLCQYDGELWTRWNDKMRDQLVDTQKKDAHEAGSWYYPGGHANEAGGRLYCTSLACMTLEVYYRHLPLYKKSSTNDDFE